MTGTLEKLDPGLAQADALKPGRGWVTGEVYTGSADDTSVILQSGVKVNALVALYGDAWWRFVPMAADRYGGDVGARIAGRLDAFASGWGDTAGAWGTSAGFKYRF